MSPNWTTLEREAMRNFLAADSHLRSALEKFAQAQAEHNRMMCAAACRELPRRHEMADFYADKAGAFGEFMALLEAAAEQQV